MELSDETEPVAPKKATEVAKVSVKPKEAPKDEAPKDLPVATFDGTMAPLPPAPPTPEAHQVEDLINASSVLVGCLPEVFSGAAHKAGWEMTDTVTVQQAKQAVSDFLSTPA